ncbi:hypothetical protein E2562_008487 [Oryza meyeriana var. granulata]|uniref:DUF1664 domain-containing protein n=1 Tax=Oryza meyeriana var. granulata TaxID=110450 RepID=A0A6G1EH94_9ORYZ|nr:hypothetical protein E2562_008487 [Oryza meyeriana var. granulata]
MVLGNVAILLGSGILGSVLVGGDAKLPSAGEVLSGAAKFVKKHGNEGKDTSSNSDAHTARLLSQVNNLRQEIQSLGSRHVTVVTSASKSGPGTFTITAVVVAGVVGYAYIKWKGWKLSDMMFVTKRGLSDACNVVGSQLDKVSDDVTSARKHLAGRIDRVDISLDETQEIIEGTRDEVTVMHGDLSAFQEDLLSVNLVVRSLESKLVSLEYTQVPAASPAIGSSERVVRRTASLPQSAALPALPTATPAAEPSPRAEASEEQGGLVSRTSPKLAAALDEEGKGATAVAAAVRDANKRTALHFAAREGRTDVCDFLIADLGLPVDPKDDDGETPLIHATRQGHLQTVTYLLQHGADPSIASNLGATPLHHAAGIGNLDLMKLFLSKGVDVESESDAGTPLIWAAGHAQQEALELLLQHNAKPNTETDDGITPLLSAVAAGSLPCLEVLIQAGADPNIRAGGATPLHIAADGGSVEIINCLLKAGSDPNACDDDGLKPIQVAALRNNREVVELLLPLTSPIPGVSNWSIDGIIEYTKSVEEKAQVKEVTAQKTDRLQRPQLVEVSSEAKERSLEAKSRGDDAFRNKDYLVAVDAYTQAIELNPNDATLHSNRSLCWLRAGQAERALEDARACRALRPDWAKACYREGAALRLLQRFDEAANAFYEGVQLEPENSELVSAFREAVEAGRKFHGTDKQKAKADAPM